MAVIHNSTWISSRDLHPGGSDNFDLTRTVNAGDWIAFKVYKRGDKDYDYTYFTQKIELTSD